MNKMEVNEKLEVGIGTKETEKLKPAKVQVVTVDLSPPKTKEGQPVKSKTGKVIVEDIVTLGCKHPDKDGMIEISRTKFEKNGNLVESGIWFQQDEDKMIPKNSALAAMLRYYKLSTLKELGGKELETVADKQGFLCIKAY